MRVSESQDFGTVTMRIEEILKENVIIKNDLTLVKSLLEKYVNP